MTIALEPHLIEVDCDEDDHNRWFAYCTCGWESGWLGSLYAAREAHTAHVWARRNGGKP